MSVVSRVIWHLYAGCYDSVRHLLPYQQLHQDVLNLAAIQSADYVLDVGAGTGNSRYYCGPGAKWLLIDGSVAMLKRARRKFRADPRVSVQVIDFTEPAQQKSLKPDFTVCLSVNALYNDPDPVGQLAWLHSITTPRGRLVLAGPWRSADMSDIMKKHSELLVAQGRRPHPIWLLLANLPAYLINKWYLQPRMSGPHTCPQSQDQLESWLKSAGWHPTQITSTYAGTSFLVSASKTEE